MSPLNQVDQPLKQKMPLLFVGHGSPMHAIASNEFTKTLAALGKALPRPKVILVVSAHWLTTGTWVTAMAAPKTIHDFYGFPKTLFDVEYPAPGSPETAKLIQKLVTCTQIQSDFSDWGLDHGAWAPLKQMYPKADIPVLQLSLDLDQPPEYHKQIGKELAGLRNEGVLIMGSGNLVHNLKQILWEPAAAAYDWAVEFDEWLKEKLVSRAFKAVLTDFHQTPAGKLSVPSMDHYYPLHYILGAAESQDPLKFEYEEIQNGSISMRSFRLG